MNERETKAAEALERAINDCGFSPRRFAEQTTRWHRYLQNEMFKLAVSVIRVYGSEDYGHDLRNQYAHDTARRILESGALD